MPDPDDQDFLIRAEAAMRAVLTALDGFDPDELEADLAGGVLRITFADQRSCIMNRQSAANQLWLAEGATAWHFEYAPASDAWLDTKGRGELRAVLGEVVSRRLGRSVTI